MGLVAMSGGPVEELRLGGKVFKLRRAELGSVISKAMQQMVSERPDPIAALSAVVQSMPPKEKETAWRAAFEAHQKRSQVTILDLQDWITEPTGASWLVWHLIQASKEINATDEYPDGTLGIESQEQLLGIIGRMEPHEQIEFGNKVTVLLGIEDVKN